MVFAIEGGNAMCDVVEQNASNIVDFAIEGEHFASDIEHFDKVRQG